VPLSEILKDALFAEEADRDFAEAEKGYREILRRFDSERAHAATAALRLAEVLNGRGETEEAEKLYARVVREFGDQKAVVEVAMDRLGDKALVAGDAMAESRVNRLEKMLAESPDLLNTEVDGKTPLERAAEKPVDPFVIKVGATGVSVDGREISEGYLAQLVDYASRVSALGEEPQVVLLVEEQVAQVEVREIVAHCARIGVATIALNISVYLNADSFPSPEELFEEEPGGFGE
jgi:tetratricopeptide (TPR) repeat protein